MVERANPPMSLLSMVYIGPMFITPITSVLLKAASPYHDYPQKMTPPAMGENFFILLFLMIRLFCFMFCFVLIIMMLKTIIMISIF